MSWSSPYEIGTYLKFLRQFMFLRIKYFPQCFVFKYLSVYVSDQDLGRATTFISVNNRNNSVSATSRIHCAPCFWSSPFKKRSDRERWWWLLNGATHKMRSQVDLGVLLKTFSRYYSWPYRTSTLSLASVWVCYWCMERIYTGAVGRSRWVAIQ